MEADPNLIVVGAQKCGTTSLHRYLDAHPEVAMHRLKETDFFLDPDPSDQAVRAYRSGFALDAAVRGEASPNYTNLPKSEGTAERIASMLPGARLIYLVRDPIDRLLSQYVHYRAANVERRPLAEAIRDPRSSYVNRSRYAAQLRPYRAAFPAARIRVVASEDLLDARAETLRSLFEFLGVDPSFSSDEFDRLWEETSGKSRLYRLIWPVAAAARARGVTTPRALKWPVQRLLRGRRRTDGGARAGAPDPSLLSRDDRELLRSELSRDVDEFAAIDAACANARQRWHSWDELAAPAVAAAEGAAYS